MHTQGVNVSSEMIKEMGIRILDGVNEMYLWDSFERAIYRRQRELPKKLVSAYRQASI